jgi:hypothetical protein
VKAAYAKRGLPSRSDADAKTDSHDADDVKLGRPARDLPLDQFLPEAIERRVQAAIERGNQKRVYKTRMNKKQGRE